MRASSREPFEACTVIAWSHRMLVRRYLKVARQIMANWRAEGRYSVRWHDLVVLHEAAWICAGLDRASTGDVLEAEAARRLAAVFGIDPEAFAVAAPEARLARGASKDNLPEDKIVIPDDDAPRSWFDPRRSVEQEE